MISASPVADLPAANGDRAQARTADLVEAPGSLLTRNAGGDRGLAGRVLALAGGQDLAHDDFVDFSGLDAWRAPARADRDPAKCHAPARWRTRR